jgi:hypothetical protein
MVRRIAHWSFIVMTLLAAPAAFAQAGSPPASAAPTGEPPPIQPTPMPSRDSGQPHRGAAAAEIRAACGRDVRRLCFGIQPGGGRIIECLLAHGGALSSTCSAELRRMRPVGVSTTIPRAQRPAPAPPLGTAPSPDNAPSAGDRAAFRASCGPDVQLFCGETREKEGITSCLASHRAELSPTCKDYIQQMRAERGAQRSGPSYNPATPPPPIGSETFPPPKSEPSTQGAPPAAGTPQNE